MLSWVENKPLATKIGIGRILDQERLVLNVLYTLNIFQEVRVYETKDLREEVEGQNTFKGNITILENYKNPGGIRNLILQLEDGTKIAIAITRAIDPVNNRYEIEIGEDFCWI